MLPVALAVRKPGRGSGRDGWCVVAKLVLLDGQPVLAVVHRRQRGVATTISVPLAVLGYAERYGARWLYFRRDADGSMRRLPLAEVRAVGWLGPGAGAECYVAIAKMQPCGWRPWAYAEEVVRLGEADAPEPAGRQAPLPGLELAG